MKTKTIFVCCVVMLLATLSCKKIMGAPEAKVTPVPSTPEEMAEVLDIELPAYSVDLDTLIEEGGVSYHVMKLAFDEDISDWVKSVVENDTTWYDNVPEGYVKEVESCGGVSTGKTMYSDGMTVTFNIMVHGYISPEHNGLKLYTLDDSKKVQYDMGIQP